jgi:hypothetical protein
VRKGRGLKPAVCTCETHLRALEGGLCRDRGDMQHQLLAQAQRVRGHGVLRIARDGVVFVAAQQARVRFTIRSGVAGGLG